MKKTTIFFNRDKINLKFNYNYIENWKKKLLEKKKKEEFLYLKIESYFVYCFFE